MGWSVFPIRKAWLERTQIEGTRQWGREAPARECYSEKTDWLVARASLLYRLVGWLVRPHTLEQQTVRSQPSYP